MAMYFTSDTENAIIEFNSITGSYEKNYIYTAKIHKPMNKLVENIIHTFKFYNYDTTYDDLKHDTVTFLFDKLGNYDPNESKAYSYFTIVARNYLIARSRDSNVSSKSKSDLEEVDNNRNILYETSISEYRGMVSSFVYEWTKWGMANIDQLFHRDRDRRVAEAIFVLFRDNKNIENYNKKALYILIREYSGNITTQYITRVVNRLRTMYADMYKDYVNNITINWNSYRIKYIRIDREEL